MVTLTKEEREWLAKMESKLDHVRAAVRGVVKEFHTGLFLHGEGGTSKSYTVTEELQRLKCKYTLHNTRMTGRGLVDVLKRAPSDVHFIEDAETMLDDRKSWGVLRSALWSQSQKKPMERRITWNVFNVNIDFIFTGGIIVISNANLSDTIPEVRAIKSRINILQMDFNAEEIKALMKKICLAGYTFGPLFLAPEECLEVRHYVIERFQEMRRPLDLRMMVNGFRDMLQFKSGESGLHWNQLLEGRMAERVVYQDRNQKNAEKQRIALEIEAMKLSWEQKVKLWKDKTTLSAAAFDRARKRKR